eukprot:5678438-Amphidinium_carterae.1
MRNVPNTALHQHVQGMVACNVRVLQHYMILSSVDPHPQIICDIKLLVSGFVYERYILND